METAKLKKFAQHARRSLIEQVSNKLKLVLAKDSAARRESAEAVEKLEQQIQAHGEEQVIEKVAYIWFNRFCALRFMDVNRYTRIGVVSPAEGQSQPEILAEAKMGHIDEGMVDESARNKIFALLDGKTPSQEPQAEAYRLLVVAICNYWHGSMPFMFERIADYTELLMPDDLLSDNSILAHTRKAMTPEACEDVEVIGWLYQFYISEKKDEVFEGLKKNRKITPENIPAATQLFTPHWIVRYLVENSLGRLWMLNRTDSRLVEQMDYYIKPEQQEPDFLRISSPEEIKICDPACGSGHMLTYAFDLLYAIYEEEGYEPAEIPEKILTNNLYGIEIDERAGELAAFALTMKARAKQRRFFRKQVQPNICVLENIQFGEGELKEYMDFIGRDLFTAPLQTTLRQFEEADNFGSLIRPDVTDVDRMLRILESKNVSGQLFISMTHQKVLQALRQADYLSPKYHVVITNPPYMGGSGMNQALKDYIKASYSEGQSDLFTSFLLRSRTLVMIKGVIAFLSPIVWMVTSSFEKLRKLIIEEDDIRGLVQLEYNAFEPACVPVCAYMISRGAQDNSTGTYIDLKRFTGHENQAPRTLDALKDTSCNYRYSARTRDFMAIDGWPIAYNLSGTFREIFKRSTSLKEISVINEGVKTRDNGRFMRLWHETSRKINVWKPYAKGGGARRWYGNALYIVRWDNELWDFPKASGCNFKHFEKPTITYSTLSSHYFSCRYIENSFFGGGGAGIVCNNEEDIPLVLSILHTKVIDLIMKVLSPTLNFEVGTVGKIPVVDKPEQFNIDDSWASVAIARKDWDSFEISWDFTSLPLRNPDYRQPTLKATYQKLRTHWREMTLEMQRLEKENNHIFIDAYGLQDELSPEVLLNEITLTCNPHYRYNGDKGEEELEALLLADTMRELVSYAVGCMFGRYALDKPGLILANQGETIDDYLKQIPDPTFPADDDNVIPMLDGNWFTDDITERFYKFLRVTFGEEHYEENLEFIEQAIGKNIRKYFLKDFYNDHVKRYKKRPIYWLFSSPKGSFNALIYMHRYRPDTVSVVLNDYLREFRAKLASRKDHLEAVSISASATQGEKTRALKEIEKINKMIAELEEYERDVLYPLATEQVEIDLDDGVKVNYNKFGAALKKIAGLSGKG